MGKKLARKTKHPQYMLSVNTTSIFYFACKWCGGDTTQAHNRGTEPCAINDRASTW